MFLGRETDLENIHKILFVDDNHRLLLMYGDGGIGKTSLAAKYWEIYKENYKHLAWIFAQSSLLDALLRFLIHRIF